MGRINFLKFLVLFVFSLLWYLVIGIVGGSVPIWGEMWLPHLLCALITSLLIGLLFYKPIIEWTSWNWYFLPILTLATSTIIFGFLLPFSGMIYGKITANNSGVDGEAFYLTPITFLFYSFTYFIVLFYPLALITQSIMRYSFRKIEKGKTDKNF